MVLTRLHFCKQLNHIKHVSANQVDAQTLLKFQQMRLMLRVLSQHEKL